MYHDINMLYRDSFWSVASAKDDDSDGGGGGNIGQLCANVQLNNLSITTTRTIVSTVKNRVASLLLYTVTSSKLFLLLL